MMASRALPLLIEIGCEEIPARFLEEARLSFNQRLTQTLVDNRLLPPAPRAAHAYGTPRRLASWFPEVLEKQPDRNQEVFGPSIKIAYDTAGNPTKAALSFVAKNGANVQDLVTVVTPKGEYVALRKTTSGRVAMELLPEILPGVVTGMSFPKSMYWTAKSGPRFVRPIRWILAILGEGGQARIIPFEIAGVRTGDITYGHRVLGSGPSRISGLTEYSSVLRRKGVEFDPAERRRLIERGIEETLQGSELRIIKDRELEDWMVNSTEHPRFILGNFEERFLELPREILITVMRDHQKYFAVENAAGRLEPKFIALLNHSGDPRGLIQQGHERVLRARFSDARFFWEADQKIPLRDRAAMLEQVTYQAKLGTYADKVHRMAALATALGRLLNREGKLKPGDQEHIRRAIQLSKCDLTTQMVQEFTELQGIVGGLYARAQGEPAEVADAIYDQYLPMNIEDRCPRTIVGAVVSIVDKLDGVAGGFAVGEEPTGSSDPYALRRQGNGLIKVILEVLLPISLERSVGYALQGLKIETVKPRQELAAAILEFLKERLRYYLETVPRFRYDTVRAVLATGSDAPVDVLRRAEALEKIRDSEDFEAISSAAKRIRNILTKSATADDWKPGEVDEELLEPGAESELWQAYGATRSKVNIEAEHVDYHRLLEVIAGLRPAVDRFFDKVLVMAADRDLRQNRLRLLGKLDELFSSIADLAEIVPSAVGADSRSGLRRQAVEGQT